jgi:hypothetical protein
MPAFSDATKALERSGVTVMFPFLTGGFLGCDVVLFSKPDKIQGS